MKVLLISILLIFTSAVFPQDKAKDMETGCKDGTTRWVESASIKKEIIFLAKTADRPDLSMPEPIKGKNDDNTEWFDSKTISFPFQTITLHCKQEEVCKNGSWVKTNKCKTEKEVRDEIREFVPPNEGGQINTREMTNFLQTCTKWFNFPGVVDEKQIKEKVAAFKEKCEMNCK